MQPLETNKILSPKNTPLDLKKWKEIIEDWNVSQESQKNYCQRLGISMNTFSYVRGKLLQKQRGNSKFIPVLVNASEEKNIRDESTIILENAKGLKLHIPQKFSSEQISKIIKIFGW